MIIKLIGTILLSASGVAVAISVNRFHKRRLATLDGLISLIFFIKGQVDCYARPVCEILTSMPPEILLHCNCNTGVASLEEIAESCKGYLDDEPYRLILTFATEFGTTFREEQLRRCDYYIDALGERRRQLEPTVAARSRSSSAVCICASLCVAILLW